MVRRRRSSPWPLIAALLGIAFLCACALVVYIANPHGGTPSLPFRSGLRAPSRITRANYDRIKVGMSQADVLKILGPKYDVEASAAYGIDESEGTTEVLAWKLSEDSGIGVGFYRCKLFVKAQRGIKGPKQ